MSARSTRSPISNVLPAALLLATIGLGGCQWNWSKLRGEGYHDELSSYSSQLRKGPSDGSPLGASQKALDIERNLGYR